MDALRLIRNAPPSHIGKTKSDKVTGIKCGTFFGREQMLLLPSSYFSKFLELCQKFITCFQNCISYL